MPQDVQFETLYTLILALAHIQGVEPDALLGTQKTESFQSFRHRFSALQLRDLSDMMMEAQKQLEEFKKRVKEQKDVTPTPTDSSN